MAEPPIHSFTFTGSHYLHPTELLSNIGNTHPQSNNPHFPPIPQHPDWRPTNIHEFNTWNTSPEGIFPSTPIDPGQNPNPSLPQSQPHPTRTTSNARKRKRANPPSPRETPSVGGYGPLAPGESTTGTNSLNPSPPPFTRSGRRNGAYDVWAFASPLMCNKEPPVDQWPTSLDPRLTTKPKSPWFGCRLCSEFGYVHTIHLPAIVSY